METFVALVLGAAALGYGLWRATIVFEVVARDGVVIRARGRMPGELFREVRDVLERARATGRVRGRLDGGDIAVQVTRDLGPDVAQRLRNVVGRFPAARIKTGPRLADPRGDA